MKTVDTMNTVVLTLNTIFLMLGMGSATDWKQVIRHAWPPIGILIGMTCQFLLLPALGTFLAWLFSLTPYEAMGVLMISCSPGGSFSNFFTYWLDGDLALSIVMTTFSSAVALVAMPLNLLLYSQLWIESTDQEQLVVPYNTVMTALCFISVPVAVGMVIRHYNVRVAATITKLASIVGWIGVMFMMVTWPILYWRVFLLATPLILLVAALLPLVGFCLAYGMALLLCRSHQICRTIGVETGSQNMPVALSIILLSFPDPQTKGAILVFPTLYALVMCAEVFVGIAGFHLWRRRRQQQCPKEQEALHWEKEALALTVTNL